MELRGPYEAAMIGVGSGTPAHLHLKSGTDTWQTRQVRTFVRHLAIEVEGRRPEEMAFPTRGPLHGKRVYLLAVVAGEALSNALLQRTIGADASVKDDVLEGAACR